MAILSGQTRAIVWAQWRALMNYYFRRRQGFWSILTAIVFLLWYGFWNFAAFLIAAIVSDPENTEMLQNTLPLGLLAVFGYWQLVPLMLVSTGLSLDLSRLLVYPVPRGRLFGIEVMLRITTAFEMVIVTAGLAIGLMLNPAIPWWAPLVLLPFTALNLFTAAGVRDLLTRLMARRGFRELAVFVLVLIAALPQVLLLAGDENPLSETAKSGFGWFWPWSVAGRLASGFADALAWLLLFAWTVLAYWFGIRQFERSLRFDVAAARASARLSAKGAGLAERLFRLPSVLFGDPLGALVEKELRVLSRSPRFRLLFLMGFSFGLLIWLPIALRGDEGSIMRSNYLSVVSVYALMLLGEVCFWNSFGMDRAAAQTYFVTPVPMRTVLAAKNISASFFIMLELLAVTVVCFALRMPLTIRSVTEAFAVTAVLALFMLSMGNLLSVRYPRAIDPAQSWKSGSVGRVQAFLLVLYPVAAAPVLLAYGARYAFDTDMAFYIVIAVDVAVGAVLYSVSMDSAAGSADSRREDMIHSLSGSEGPVGA